MSLGKRLVELRKMRKMTQEDLAKALGVSRGAVSMWEIDQRTPDPSTLQRIANYFGVSVDYLLGNNPQTQPDPFSPYWWHRNTPPSDVELEEFLKTANIYFDGVPLNEEDKEDILTYLKVKWEREKKKRGRR